MSEFYDWRQDASFVGETSRDIELGPRDDVVRPLPFPISRQMLVAYQMVWNTCVGEMAAGIDPLWAEFDAAEAYVQPLADKMGPHLAHVVCEVVFQDLSELVSVS